MELSVPRCSSSRSRRLRAVATKRRLWELSKSEHAVGMDPMASTFYPAEFYMASHHFLATLISQTSNVCQAILESVTQQKVPFHPEESGHDDDRGVQEEFVPHSAYVANEDSIEFQDVPPDMSVEKIAPTLNPDDQAIQMKYEARFIGNPWFFLLPEECARISSTSLSNRENCHWGRNVHHDTYVTEGYEAPKSDASIIIDTQLAEDACGQVSPPSLATSPWEVAASAGRDGQEQSASALADQGAVDARTAVMMLDMNDMVQAELERIRQNTEKRFVAFEADIEMILNDRSRLATENRELQRKYQSLKDMYLDLCAKS